MNIYLRSKKYIGTEFLNMYNVAESSFPKQQKDFVQAGSAVMYHLYVMKERLLQHKTPHDTTIFKAHITLQLSLLLV